jgi:broad specificity phosphatase PhoE
MEIVLIRHAQPAWADAHGAAVNDPGLTDRGHRQAALVAERLAGSGWDGHTQLLVSTARRSRETASPIAAALGLEPSYQPWLHEIRLPDDWEGTPAEEVGRLLREARKRPRADWWEGLAAGGGESFRGFHQRVTDGLERCLRDLGLARHSEDPGHVWVVPEHAPRLVVVAHAGTNSVVLGHLLGLEPQPWEWERFSSNHASVTVLDTTSIAGGSIWSLQLFSGAAHFEGDLVTS